MRHLKKYSMYVLVLILSFTFVGQGAQLSAETQVLYISDTEAFLKFAARCVSDSWSKDKEVILTGDIDLTGTDFSGIPIFTGTFDGAGYTISGLRMIGEGSQQGLFRYLEAGGVIKNLHVSGRILPGGSKSYIGGLVGQNKGTIENCYFTGVVEGEQYIGGLVGLNQPTGMVIKSNVSGRVEGRSYVGGIVGENQGTIIRCTNVAQINTKVVSEQKLEIEELISGDVTIEEEVTNASDITDIGGISGRNVGIIQGSMNKGTVGYEHVGYNVGGIAGRQSGYINECQNEGTIYGRKEVGGIVGQMEPYVVVKFTQSKLAEIGRELDTLQSLIQSATGNGRGTTDVITQQLDQLQNSTKEVRSYTEGLLGQTEGLLNQNIDKVNEVSVTVAEALDKVVPITTALEEMGSELEQLSDPIQEGIDYLIDASEQMDEGVDSLKEVSTRLQSVTDEIESATWSIKTGMTQFNVAVEKLKNGELIEAIHSVKNVATYLEQAGDEMTSAMSRLEGVYRELDDFLGHGQDVNGSIRKAMSSISKVTDVMDHALGSFSEALSYVNELASYLADQPEVSFVTTDSSYEEAKNQLSQALEGTEEVVSQLNHVINQQTHLLLDDMEAIANQLFVVFDLMLSLTEDAISTEVSVDEYKEDISEVDTLDQTEGKVAKCINKGTIAGDINVGGIAGAMAVERSFDPEDDLESEGDRSINFIFQSRAVIRECSSSGDIRAKKDSVGGIVGSMKLGYIVDSYAEGKVESSGGNYIGGIAGKSESTIQSSYAKCTLSGGNYIGGIAGMGKNISQSGAYIEVLEGKEYMGAISGYIDEKGTLRANYFVEGAYQGVDGISYEGKAEPLTYEDFMSLEKTPEAFGTFKWRFWVDGVLVETRTFKYGETLTLDSIPNLSDKAGYYGSWDGLAEQVITFDKDIEAYYQAYRSTLESDKRRDDTLPILLIEGQFREGDILVVEDYEEAFDLLEEDTLVAQWQVEIPEDGSLVHTVRYLMPEDIKHGEIYVKVGTEWVYVESETDGKYSVFQVEGNEVICSVVSTNSDSIEQIIYLIALVLIGVVGLIVVKKTRKKHTNIAA